MHKQWGGSKFKKVFRIIRDQSKSVALGLNNNQKKFNFQFDRETLAPTTSISIKQIIFICRVYANINNMNITSKMQIFTLHVISAMYRLDTKTGA